ncbi:hypothetical protein HAX54_001555 [Datura stramonium]|uniref:Uncharacterized protein n=1 Tax=Datura stramonium TaxID=4076 RepID=A0ABS8T4Q8_DATST|nr:hypothetical protein [Datura stramonium]
MDSSASWQQALPPLFVCFPEWRDGSLIDPGIVIRLIHIRDLEWAEEARLVERWLSYSERGVLLFRGKKNERKCLEPMFGIPGALRRSNPCHIPGKSFERL